MKCPKCKKDIDLSYVEPSEPMQCPHCRLRFGEKALMRYATENDYLSVCQNKEMLIDYIKDENDINGACSDMDCRCYDCIFNKNDEKSDMMSDMGFDDEEEYEDYWEGYASDKD